jgi:hypothetical protein
MESIMAQKIAEAATWNGAIYNTQLGGRIFNSVINALIAITYRLSCHMRKYTE